MPRPPEYLDSRALLLMARKISARSSPTVVRKQEESCGRRVPALNRVGVEHMKSNDDSSS